MSAESLSLRVDRARRRYTVTAKASSWLPHTYHPNQTENADLAHPRANLSAIERSCSTTPEHHRSEVARIYRVLRRLGELVLPIFAPSLPVREGATVFPACRAMALS